MKQSMNSGGGGGGGGGGWSRIPTQEEVEVVEILLSLPKLVAKSELIRRCSSTWGRKKKRSVLLPKSESNHRQIDESKVAAAAEDADKSPSTPLCFLPSGSGSDGVDNKPKQQSSLKKKSKRKATDDLTEKYNEMQQQNVMLNRKLQAMKTLHQELNVQNLELKAKRQEIVKLNYTKRIEDFQLWNNNPAMKLNLDQQRYHQQFTMFAPPPPPPPPQQHPPPPHCHQQFTMVDPNNGKLMAAVACSSNSNGGGRCGFFNQMDPRVKNHHGETFDFMASSQPFDHSKYMVMDNDLRVRSAAAAAARKRRIMRMKESRNSSSAVKLSRACR